MRKARKAYWSSELEEEINYPTTLEVVEEDEEFTGVLDQNGDPIFRCKPPIGFIYF